MDALGNPIKIYLTGGQVSDYTPAKDLITLFDLENSYVPADKAMTTFSCVQTRETLAGYALVTAD